MTKLQKAMAKYNGQKMTDALFNKMKIDAVLLIGAGITDNYYEKTFGDNGKIQTLAQASQFAFDAANSTGSFDKFAINRGMRRRPLKNEDDE